jgi:tRNA threonylcarbamoyl adenosine modification protein (Sua5/YciO/YrdC/YwlC family)
MPVLPSDPASLDQVEAALLAGQVVALPTDTVYGVAVALEVPGATGGLFDVKRRPRDVDLPVLVADLEQAEGLGQMDGHALALAERFWPGALTMVLARQPGVDVDLGRRAETVGLRCPDHDIVRDLCRRVGPLATTSANLHGEPTAESAAEVVRQLGGDLLVLDGGQCRGAPSTVIEVIAGPPRLLRQGRIPWEDIEEALA